MLNYSLFNTPALRLMEENQEKKYNRISLPHGTSDPKRGGGHLSFTHVGGVEEKPKDAGLVPSKIRRKKGSRADVTGILRRALRCKAGTQPTGKKCKKQLWPEVLTGENGEAQTAATGESKLRSVQTKSGAGTLAHCQQESEGEPPPRWWRGGKAKGAAWPGGGDKAGRK